MSKPVTALLPFFGSNRTLAPHVGAQLAGCSFVAIQEAKDRQMAVESGLASCKKCKIIKPLERFTKDNRLASGISSWCRECQSAAKRERRAKNRYDPWAQFIAEMQGKDVQVRPVAGFDHYRIASNGELWGVLLSRGRVRRVPRRIHGAPKGRGYLGVILYKPDGARLHCSIHTLVLQAFVGPCPDAMECRHLDGNPANNRLENLCWGTPVENAADRVLHGTQKTGESHPNAKLTLEKVREIRRKWDCKAANLPQLAAEFGVTQSAICGVVYRRNWRAA